MPYNNELGEGMLAGGNYGNTGIDDLRMHALARIVLHRRIPNIQASWVKLGKKLAQYALHCGPLRSKRSWRNAHGRKDIEISGIDVRRIYAAVRV